MYNIKELMGKTATIKFNNGIEVITNIVGISEDNDVLTITEPRVVVVNDKELAILPYMFTGDTSTVFVAMNSIQSAVKSQTQSAKDYKKILEATKA